jgi:hypothetical protein
MIIVGGDASNSETPWHADAKVALEAAAGDAMLNIQATAALRTLFARAKLF